MEKSSIFYEIDATLFREYSVQRKTMDKSSRFLRQHDFSLFLSTI